MKQKQFFLAGILIAITTMYGSEPAPYLIRLDEVQTILKDTQDYVFFGEEVCALIHIFKIIESKVTDNTKLGHLGFLIKNGYRTMPQESMVATLEEMIELLLSMNKELSEEELSSIAHELELFWKKITQGDASVRIQRAPRFDDTDTPPVQQELIDLPRDVFVERDLYVNGRAVIGGELIINGGISIPGIITNGCQAGPITIGTSDATSLSLVTQCVDRLVIDPDGAVSIVAPTNGEALNVTGNALASAIVATGNGTTVAPALTLIGNPTSSTTDFIVTIDGSGVVQESTTTLADVITNGCQTGPLTIGTSDATSITFATDSCSPRVTIDSAGAVTILTPTAGDALTVNGNSTFTGNIVIPDTTALGTAGVISKPSGRFIHNFGVNNTSTFIGNDAGNFTATGLHNTGVGASTLFNNANGTDNIAVGRFALFNNTDGQQNTAIGNSSLSLNTVGFGSTAVGYQSLINSTGSYNVAVGSFNLISNTSADANTAVGSFALRSKVAGNNNMAFGYEAGTNLTSGANNIYIGNPGVAVESNAIRIGTLGTQTTAFIQGIATSNIAGTPVLVLANGQLGVAVSSERYKKNIISMDSCVDKLDSLRPVNFHFNEQQDDEQMQYGLIAEEVAKVYPDLVIYDENNKPYTVRYQEFISILIKAIQELNYKVKAVKQCHCND